MSILLTGGSGRLGTELQDLLTVTAPTEEEMDIRDDQAVLAVVEEARPDVIVHCAGYTDVTGAEADPRACWDVNVRGTRNVVVAAIRHGAFLVHLSTDYVFAGTKGMYTEDDPVGPVCNYYALSKLAAEEVVRTAPAYLILRTSFRPRQWPYPVAFTDLHTSQDYIDIVAPMIAAAIRHYREIPFDTLHVATERKSSYELALRRREDVRPASKTSVDVRLPNDVSLDVSRWQALSAPWSLP